MSSNVVKVPVATWIPYVIIDVIAIFFGFIILRCEIQKRRQLRVKFTTKWFKFFSIACISCSFMMGVFAPLQFIPGLCIFSHYLFLVSFGTAGLFMGLYQLHRLYYCFANEQVHSNKGYAKWVFIIMFTWGILPWVYFCIILFLGGGDDTLSGIRSTCGFNDNHEYYFHPIQLIHLSPHHLTIIGLSFQIWDILTLFMYMYKIWTFRKYQSEQPIVYKRIMSLLHKIFILTVFYQVFSVIHIAVHQMQIVVISRISRRLVNLSISLAMYLMLDHNKEDYVRFLKVIYFMKFHWVCCCWRYFVIDQLKECDIDSQQITISVNENDDGHDSQYETRNGSANQHEEIKMADLSVATVTINET